MLSSWERETSEWSKCKAASVKLRSTAHTAMPNCWYLVTPQVLNLTRTSVGEVSRPGFTISAGFHRISVKFFVFGLHREANFGPESGWFRFQIQKYESQILVKKRNFGTVKTKWWTLRREVGSAALCHSAMWISQELFIYFSSLDNFRVILQNTNETFV